MIITNDKGRSFLVRVVKQGECYGLDDCLTHDKADPLIEFYDQKYKDKPGFGERGQFVKRYYARTLAGCDGYSTAPVNDLCLDGGNADVWYVDAAAIAPVIALAKVICVKP